LWKEFQAWAVGKRLRQLLVLLLLLLILTVLVMVVIGFVPLVTHTAAGGAYHASSRITSSSRNTNSSRITSSSRGSYGSSRDN
jgi:hypothetical protein